MPKLVINQRVSLKRHHIPRRITVKNSGSRSESGIIRLGVIPSLSGDDRIILPLYQGFGIDIRHCGLSVIGKFFSEELIAIFIIYQDYISTEICDFSGG